MVKAVAKVTEIAILPAISNGSIMEYKTHVICDRLECVKTMINVKKNENIENVK